MHSAPENPRSTAGKIQPARSPGYRLSKPLTSPTANQRGPQQTQGLEPPICTAPPKTREAQQGRYNRQDHRATDCRNLSPRQRRTEEDPNRRRGLNPRYTQRSRKPEKHSRGDTTGRITGLQIVETLTSPPASRRGPQRRRGLNPRYAQHSRKPEKHSRGDTTGKTPGYRLSKLSPRHRRAEEDPKDAGA
ncbi:hypothetical protein SAMN05421771_0058 [Granulicella pectinivorans]|uniref:Uncharacterized protein n=1 Tax=Granulicella pectinivorans TaxID=474950 RepID=A0A1I6L088_9BACT|nr:hypothetical protein SAMN05421771_0058 [Granulicella pectinivorans]